VQEEEKQKLIQKLKSETDDEKRKKLQTKIDNFAFVGKCKWS